MECHSEWHQRAVMFVRSFGVSPPREVSGQGTVEYSLVTIALLAIAICLGVLWRFVAEGGFSSIVVESLARRLAKGVVDIALF